MILTIPGHPRRQNINVTADLVPLRLAVFDLAGTTVYDDSVVTQALLDALAHAGYEIGFDAINGRMGIPKPVAIREVLPGVDEATVELIHQDFRRRIISHYKTHPDVREIAGATELFRTLRAAGVKVGLDTGFDRETTDAIFDRLAWNGEFDASATSDEVERGRPAPDLIWRLMELTGVDDVRAVAKVGDTPSDLGEGTAAGCGWVIGVTYGTHSAAQLANYSHTHLVDSVSALEQLLRSAITA